MVLTNHQSSALLPPKQLALALGRAAGADMEGLEDLEEARRAVCHYYVIV